MISVNVTHPSVYVGGVKIATGEQTLKDDDAKRLIERGLAVEVVSEERLEVATPKPRRRKTKTDE